MIIRIIGLAIVLSIGISSCSNYARTTIRKFRFCYDGTNTGLDTLIEMKGFYAMDVTFCEDNSWNYSRVVFYPDGIFLENPQLENIVKYKEDINSVGKYWNWGIYKISNDTIVGQYLHVDGATSSCESVYYKIIDKYSIQRIHPVDRSNVYINETYDYRPLYYYKFSYSKAKFVPYCNLPNTDNSKAKGKSWFWCNKEQYKEWKKNNKNRKSLACKSW